MVAWSIFFACIILSRSHSPPTRVLYRSPFDLVCCCRLLTVSSRSLHNLHLLFCCVFWYFASTYLIFMMLFNATIRRDSISFFRLPYRRYVHVFSCAISSICRLKYPWNCFCHFRFLLFVAFLLFRMLPLLFLAVQISLH